MLATPPPTLTRRELRYWVMKPDPRLRRLVHCYYLAHPVAATQWDPSAAFHEQELMFPDGHAEIVFHLGGAFERRLADGAKDVAIMRRSYVIGGRSRSVLTRDLDRVTVAGVKLDPRLLYALLRIPLSEFADDTLGFDELGSAGLPDLEHAVAGAAHCATQVAAVLDTFLLRALAAALPATTSAAALAQEIRARRGALSILDWIREHRFDPRNIERRFSETMGMTPKRYARVIRFKHRYHLLVSGKGSTEFLDGFHDRSHFNREFRSFVGVAPSARINGSLEHGTSISDALLASELAAA